MLNQEEPAACAALERVEAAHFLRHLGLDERRFHSLPPRIPQMLRAWIKPAGGR